MLKASHNVGTVTDKVYELETNPPKGGGGILPDKEANGDVQLDGVAFSRLE